MRWLHAKVQFMFNESPLGGLVHDAAFGAEVLQPGCFTLFSLEALAVAGLCAPSVRWGVTGCRMTMHTQVEVMSVGTPQNAFATTTGFFCDPQLTLFLLLHHLNPTKSSSPSRKQGYPIFAFNPWEVPSGEVEQILSGGRALLLPLCFHALLCSCCCGNKGQSIGLWHPF